jgi:acyl carrier protein
MAKDIETNIREIICSVLDRTSISFELEHSLTIDIGFDSMQLMQFFAGIEKHYPKIALEHWFLEQSQEGQDTIASLLRFISATNSSREVFAA